MHIENLEESKMSTMTTATFKVTSQHYTEMARNRVLDGEWREAVQILIEGFEGMTYDIAYSILNGTHNICSINGNLEVIEELDKEYQEEVRDIYCNNKFYEMNKLYEFVSDINLNDVHEDIQQFGINHKPPAFYDYICQYMLNKNEKAFEVSQGKKKRVIVAFEVNSNTMPIWISKDWFCNSVKAYAQKHPNDVYIKSGFIEVSENQKKIKTPEKSFPSEISSVNEMSITDKITIMHAEQIAHDSGFQTIEEFSEHWRNIVMNAIKERGCEWKEFTYISDTNVEQIKYPYDLAVAYALNRTNIRGFAPKWEPICKSGLKIDNDSRLHSDLWLALGFNFDGLVYKSSTRENDILSSLMSNVQGQFIPKADITILNSANLNTFTGNIVFQHNKNITKNDILVIPQAGPEFEVQALKAGMVISETGGKLAHLVIVGREFGLPLIRFDNAMKNLSEGMKVHIDFNNFKLEIIK